MGIGPRFSVGTNYTPKEETSPNPNKFRFEILDCVKVGDYALLSVHYPDCTTFNGKKILIISTTADPYSLTELDPHFLDNGIVIARFQPTIEGAKLAESCFKSLTDTVE